MESLVCRSAKRSKVALLGETLLGLLIRIFVSISEFFFSLSSVFTFGGLMFGLRNVAGADDALFLTSRNALETSFIWLEATVSIWDNRSNTDWRLELVSRPLFFDRSMLLDLLRLGGGDLGSPRRLVVLV